MLSPTSSQQPTLADLNLSLSAPKKSTTPPAVIVALKNTHPSTPITILIWSSPIDPLLIQLGLLTITPPGSATPLDIPKVMVKRRMPPPPQSLVTLESGEEVFRTVELGERFVSAEQLRGDGSGKARVQVKGTWMAIWTGRRKEELADSESLKTLGHDPGDEEGVLRGEFESEVLEIEVD